MLSMTGFGRSCASFSGGEFQVEVTSINRKQLEVRTVIPNEFAADDNVLRKLVANYVSRGQVYIKVAIAKQANSTSGIEVDKAALLKLIEISKEVRSQAGLSSEVNVETLMAIPDIVTSGKQLSEEEHAIAVEQLTKAAIDALEQFQAMRLTEGEALKLDFANRLQMLKNLLDEIIPFVEDYPDRIKAKLMERLAKENIPVDVTDEQLLKEVLYYTDRADVTEEITRLRSHFAQFENFLNSSTPVGRQMDFLMQEMFREITTLGNKAGSSEVSPKVIAFKSELEKIREQVQNVE
jgi:uncharacterized protein (TIGR00255 family)